MELTTEETIEAGNAAIIKFMGGEIKENLTVKNYATIGIPSWAFTIFDFDTLKIGGYRYHSDWSWLMPVVEKIESLGYDTTIVTDEDGQQFMIWDRGIYSYNRQESNLIVPNRVTGEKLKIKAVWLGVVQFIQYHNTTNP